MGKGPEKTKPETRAETGKSGGEASGNSAEKETKETTKIDVSGRPDLKRIKVTSEQLQQLQKDKRLVGWDPAKQEAIIKREG